MNPPPARITASSIVLLTLSSILVLADDPAIQLATGAVWLVAFVLVFVASARFRGTGQNAGVEQ